MHTAQRHPAGFTLIELLVVATLTVLIMMTVTTVFMTFLITSYKANIQQRVKNEGERALSQIEFTLRNAQRLSPNLDGSTICNNDPDVPMTSLGVEGLDGYKTILQAYPAGAEARIASHSTAINDYYYLTSDDTTLSNLKFTCLAGEDANVYYITVSFDLKIGTGTTRDRETAIESFQSGLTLRNF